MVAESQTQGVLSQNGSAHNGKSHSAKKAEEVVTVQEPDQVVEYYPANTLGCSDGESTGTAQILQLKANLPSTVCRGVEGKSRLGCHTPPLQQQ